MSQPSSSDGVVTSARASPGERSSHAASRSAARGSRRHTWAATAVHTRSRSTSGGAVSQSFAHHRPPSRGRVPAQRRPQQPPGPVRAALDRALRDPHQLAPPRRPAGPRRTSAATPRGPGCLPARAPPPRRRDPAPRQRRLGRVAARCPSSSTTPAGARPPGPGGAGTARPAAGRSPRSRPRRSLRPVTAGARPDREEGLLQHVLDVRRGEHRPEPGGQPRRVPAEQLPQRRVVAAGHPGDQLLVVHRLSIASSRPRVHGPGKFLKQVTPGRP